MPTIQTAEQCTKCSYGLIEEQDKAHVYIRCLARDKKYFYGQIIYCDNYNKKKEVPDED